VVFSWRRFRERVTAVLHLDEEPSRLAAGMAVGVFIGITPFFFFHTVLALIVAHLFRLNKAATITGAWLNLPWFAPFVYGFSLKLGELILSGNLSTSWSTLADLAEAAAANLRASPREQAGTFVELLWTMPERLWNVMFVASKPLFVGTTLVGIVLGLATYFITLEAIRDVRRLRHRIHPARRSSEGPPPSGEPRA